MEHHTQLSYLDSLNSSQRQAVEATEGPVLVLAGAGTGKTRVLITRLAYILHTHRAHPHEVLAVTFTNKAAFEMKERAEKMLGYSAQGLWIGTFHSLAARILRRHGQAIGIAENFTILDSDDQVRVVRQIMKDLGQDDSKKQARIVLNHIQSWKDKGLFPEDVPPGGMESMTGLAAHIYPLYQERLKGWNALDFGDLLLCTVHLFRQHPDILGHYQQQFKYLMVDEYQDTNVTQYLWLRLLSMRAAGEKINLCCVGDDDQSIYSWRGAEVANILRFEKDFPGAVFIRLEQNYRSTPHILATASHLIAHNRERHGKTLWTESDHGEKVRVHALWDGQQEARWVCDEVESLTRKGVGLHEMALLVRASFQTREFEERLVTLGIPYQVVGGLRFYERQEVRDAIAYLRLVSHPHDDLAFERIINTPRRGIGEASLHLLHQQARQEQTSLFDALETLLHQGLAFKGKAKASFTLFVEQLKSWRVLQKEMHHADLLKHLLEESGYLAMWRNDSAPDSATRLENLKELIQALKGFDSIEHFLEHVSLVMENAGKSQNSLLTLMTIHSAKGLEFNTVFLPGWEDGLFPHELSLLEDNLEEERRLAYVALTRAREHSFITYAFRRRIHNQYDNCVPSRFLKELPEAHIDHTFEHGLYESAPMPYRGGQFSQGPRNNWKR